VLYRFNFDSCLLQSFLFEKSLGVPALLEIALYVEPRRAVLEKLLN
jgi:hypothetical protein